MFAGARRGLAALYFETGFFGALASFSTFMSSPWTIERTAKAPDASEATVKYTWIAHVTNLVAGAFVSVLARSLAPLLGTASGTAFMGLVYRYSRAQGLEKGSDWWKESGFEDGEQAPAVTRGRPRR